MGFPRNRKVGFWNDKDGFSIADLVIICVLPIWMYVGAKLAFSSEITREHVDFFTVLSYPLLLAVGGKSLGLVTLPFADRLGIRARGSVSEPTVAYERENEPEI